MLKPVTGQKFSGIPLKSAEYPVPFKVGLEYSAPARGTWNIVHTGMLIPEAHQIFVCAAGCLRGVVLTAAEMGAQERFSTIEIKESNLTDGTMEDLIIEGVTEILKSLPHLPPAVLVYTSCVHHFTGCDTDYAFSVIRKRFPHIDFTDCYMNPIMRKSGPDPDKIMRRQLYSLLTEMEKDSSVSVIGGDFETEISSEIVSLIQKSGRVFREIQGCKTYEEYKAMAKSSINIVLYPPGKHGCEVLSQRLNQDMLYLPVSYDYDTILSHIEKLCNTLGIDIPDFSQTIKSCDQKAQHIKNILGDTPIAIDYTATPSPFGLALFLAEHGFNVQRIYADSISPEDKEAFFNLKETKPDITLFPTLNPNMRVCERCGADFLAMGQKAAYFCGTNHFVNLVEGGGLWGFSGILQILSLMEDAFKTEKDTKNIIQIKGWGCGCY